MHKYPKLIRRQKAMSLKRSRDLELEEPKTYKLIKAIVV